MESAPRIRYSANHEPSQLKPSFGNWRPLGEPHVFDEFRVAAMPFEWDSHALAVLLLLIGVASLIFVLNLIERRK
jgi:hypothetical protein